MPELDEFSSELDGEIARKLRHGTWPAYIVRALLLRPECTTKQDALKAIRRDCDERGRRIPPSFSDTVQAAFEAHNSGSDVFAKNRGTPDQDLFFFASQKGEGKWGLRVDRATAWMAKRGFELVPPAAATTTASSGYPTGERRMILLKIMAEREEWIDDWRFFEVVPRQGEILQIMWNNDMCIYEVMDVVHDPVVAAPSGKRPPEPRVTVRIKRTRRKGL